MQGAKSMYKDFVISCYFLDTRLLAGKYCVE
jgi:hypothetical protein